MAVGLALIAGGTALITSSASGQPGPQVIRLTVPIAYVHAHATRLSAHGLSPGDGFQESWIPPRANTARRQDAVAIATFGQAIFLGTVTFKDAQLVYAGSTANQDDTTYAILGGTGVYQGARGTMSTHSLPHGRLQITLSIDRP